MAEAKQLDLILQELIRRANRSDRRLRIIEQRTQAMESRVNSAEDSNFKQSKEIKKSIMDVEIAMRNIADKIIKVESDMSKITEQTKNFARRNEIKEIETMFELLNPLTQEFVTRKELTEALRRQNR
jgi:predicted  nucleic acid-binding Zn-ribbon protein